MNKYLIAILLMMSIKTNGQIQPVKEKPVAIETLSDYEVTKDPKNGEHVFRGTFTFNDMQKDSTMGWLQKGMNSYEPDEKAMKYLNDHLRSYDMRVFLGTWCEDSQNLIPKFYKILQGVGFMPMNILVIGMDREKTTKERYMAQVKEYNVHLLPTIILINSEGKEAGRIVEGVDKSVEADLVKIIKQDRKR